MKILKILEKVANGTIKPENALKKIGDLSYQPFKDYAKLDHYRELRTGFPEVIFGQGKSDEHLCNIFKKFAEHDERVMATRVSPEVAVYVQNELSKYGLDRIVYHDSARILSFGATDNQDVLNISILLLSSHRLFKQNLKRANKVTVMCAGTADYPVAEEASVTLELHGYEALRIYDVGVACLPRLLSHVDELRESSVVLAVAGMEGALPSVVSGMVECPLIAVPTSVGYGASFNGLTPLLAMLNSCSPGMSVVNIDNGFGAAVMGIKILKTAERLDFNVFQIVFICTELA